MPLQEYPSVRLHRRRIQFMRIALNLTRTCRIPELLSRVYILRRPVYLLHVLLLCLIIVFSAL